MLNLKKFKPKRLILNAEFCYTNTFFAGPADFLVASTKIINGQNWINSVMEELTPMSTNPF